jgi:hypothetical protein
LEGRAGEEIPLGVRTHELGGFMNNQLTWYFITSRAGGGSMGSVREIELIGNVALLKGSKWPTFPCVCSVSSGPAGRFAECRRYSVAKFGSKQHGCQETNLLLHLGAAMNLGLPN